MIKKLVTTLSLAIMAATCSYGQGFVDFDMSKLGTGAGSARVFDTDGTTRAFGTGFLAQLWAAEGAGAPVSSLVAVGQPVYLRGTSATVSSAGWNQVSGTAPNGTALTTTSVQVFSGGTPGGPASIQLRVWDSSAGLSGYDIAKNGGKKFGFSSIFTVNPTANPPATPPILTGLQSFSLQVIPEPSTIGLGILGASALLFLRRRK